MGICNVEVFPDILECPVGREMMGGNELD